MKGIKMKIFKVFRRSQKLIITITAMFLLISSAITDVSATEFNLVKDINSGYEDSNIKNLTGDNQLFFWASDISSTPQQAWTLDRYHGVMKISDINNDQYIHPGIKDAAVGTHQFFYLERKSEYGIDGYELWTGTLFGVQKLKKIPGRIISSQTLSALGKYFFVPVGDPTYGTELWVSDGTVIGTHMVKDISPGIADSYLHDLTEVDNELYFIVGQSLWKSDGTAEKTHLAKSFVCDSCSDLIVNIAAVVNNTLYIDWRQYDSGGAITKHELWRYETTTNQTFKVKSFDVYSFFSPDNYTGLGTTLYFLSNTNTNYGSYKYGLWKTDGTSTGTVLLKEWDGYLDHGKLTPSDNLLYFHAGNDNDRELWATDGTSTGTYQVKDIDSLTGADSGSNFTCLTTLGDILFFTNDKSKYYEDKLWMSDGTEAGTFETNFKVNSLRCPVVINGKLYFYGNDKTNNNYGGELYTYKPVSAGTLPPIIMYLLN